MIRSVLFTQTVWSAVFLVVVLRKTERRMQGSLFVVVSVNGLAAQRIAIDFIANLRRQSQESGVGSIVLSSKAGVRIICIAWDCEA